MRTTGKAKAVLGYTLVELMLGIGCGSVVLSAAMTIGVALQRSVAAVESYSVSEGDQLRVQDYIAMDCRRAIRDNSISGLPNDGVTTDGYTPVVDTGSWIGGAWVHDSSKPVTLILSVPNYYDSNGNAQAPQFSSGSIVYGSSGGTTPISYYQSGTSLMRQIGTDSTRCTIGQRWTNCAKAIATNVNNFSVTPPSQASINADTVSYSITFAPIFTIKTYSASNPGVQGTTVFANTFLRNPDARRTINNNY
jgi:type II secretory pathway component PulJ